MQLEIKEHFSLLGLDDDAFEIFDEWTTKDESRTRDVSESRQVRESGGAGSGQATIGTSLHMAIRNGRRDSQQKPIESNCDDLLWRTSRRTNR